MKVLRKQHDRNVIGAGVTSVSDQAEVSPVTPQEILRALQLTPDKVYELVHGLSPSQLVRKPKEREWAMNEIVNHLLAGERDVILPRLERMLREDAPIFPSSASSRSRGAAGAVPGDFDAALVAFRRIREETLGFLRALKDPDWQRFGTTPTRGRITIEAYTRYLAEHDLEHLAQLRVTREVVER